MNFKVGGTCNTRKYFWSPWFAAKKNVWILDALQWLKQPNSFYLETLSFLSFVSLSSFCYARKLEATPSPATLSLVSSALIIYQKDSNGIEFWRPWNAKMKFTNGYSSKSRWEKQSHLSCYHVYSGSFMVVIKISKMVHFLYFLWITVKCFEQNV